MIMKLKIVFLILVIAIVISGVIFIGKFWSTPPFAPSAESPAQKPIELKKVYVQGTNFATEDGRFHFIGAYTVPLLEFMAYNTYFTDWKKQVDEYMESYAVTFKDAGPLVMRFQAFGPYEINDPRNELGKKYAAPNWERLDYIVNKAEEQGIYLSWVLWNYWSYEATTQGVYPRYPYWEDARIQPAIEAMVSRYKDRNVILNWEIINEGDVLEMWYPENNSQIINWIDNISTLIKRIDPDSIVSTGFASDLMTPYFETAPKDYQPVRKFIKDVHFLPNIDVLSVHIYGGSIDVMTNSSFFTDVWRQRVRWHIEEIAKLRDELNKPIMGGEWGFQRQIGDKTLKEGYQFMIDLFVENEIDNIFNGWGNAKEAPSTLLYSDDAELITIIQDGIKALKEK